jgi:hypothetical protein
MSESIKTGDELPPDANDDITDDLGDGAKKVTDDTASDNKTTDESEASSTDVKKPVEAAHGKTEATQNKPKNKNAKQKSKQGDDTVKNENMPLVILAAMGLVLILYLRNKPLNRTEVKSSWAPNPKSSPVNQPLSTTSQLVKL